MSSDLRICILAGGLSSRMGKDKSSLTLNGKSLLELIVEEASLLGVPIDVIQKDIVPRCGPLGGVLTFFKTRKAKCGLFLSCDMPFVTARTMEAIQSRLEGKTQAVFTMMDGKAGFPFLLRSSVLPMVERQIEVGDFSLQGLFASLRAAKFQPPPNRTVEYLNINSPADFRHAGQIYRKLKASKATPVLRFNHVSLWRGKRQILRNISWSVAPKEHWAILGPNGSGKTSLLNVLTGYITPGEGSIQLLGKMYGRSDWREIRKRIGFVSSAIRQLIPETELGEDIILSGKSAMIELWGRVSNEDRARARQILRRLDCQTLADQPWGYMSQGERQRMLIGRALMADPALLILDEPCAGLDPVGREHFLEFLEGLARSTTAPSILLVTHHVEEITPSFSRVLLLKEGEALAQGPTARTITCASFSQMYDEPVRINKRGGRYELRLPRGKGKSVSLFKGRR